MPPKGAFSERGAHFLAFPALKMAFEGLLKALKRHVMVPIFARFFGSSRFKGWLTANPKRNSKNQKIKKSKKCPLKGHFQSGKRIFSRFPL